MREMKEKTKDLDYYLSLPYKMEMIPDSAEGGYTVRFPDLPGCITCGGTLQEAAENAEECKRAWISAQLEDGNEIAEPSFTEKYSGQFKLRIPKSLHKELAERSRHEGVSMNQYCVYLLSKGDMGTGI